MVGKRAPPAALLLLLIAHIVMVPFGTVPDTAYVRLDGYCLTGGGRTDIG